MKYLNYEKNRLLRVFLFLISGFLVFNVNAQQKIVADETQKLQDLYQTLKNPEISFDKFVEINRHVFVNRVTNELVAAAPQDTYCGKVRTYCAGGDFEAGLDQNQYSGGYGIWYSGVYPDPFSVTYGFSSGPINSSSAHQTIVDTPSGRDPVTNIRVTPPGGGLKSLRLGNAVSGAGYEILAKTIVVDPNETILNFYYAVVFEDPGHPFQDQPAFSVRAYDCATGQELQNVCDLGNGTNVVVSDANNPFFKSLNSGSIAYRDWSLAQINLSQYVGKTVTIIFTNKDCGQGGHFGYTYLDNLFSGQCPIGPVTTNQGSVMLDRTKLDSCGNGNVCTKYTLPYKDSSGTKSYGSVRMTMYVYQNSVLVDSLVSPMLTSDSAYCFAVNPGTLKINSALGGFDYAITARFALSGFALSPITLGNPPTGIKGGTNNDYMVQCSGQPTCTPPTFLNDNTIVLDASCGMSDGNISIIPKSGVAPYMYSINGGTTYVAGPAAGYTFMGLAAGTYNLRLKDANGCESLVVTREVKSVYGGPTFLNNNQIVLDASCGKNDGELTIIPLTGVAPYMYSKDGGVTYVAGPNYGYTFENLAAGVYQLRLKGANGCESAIVSRQVKTVYNCPGTVPAVNDEPIAAIAADENLVVPCTPPTFLNDATIVLDASCNKNDGNITIVPKSGTAPYMYSKDGGATYVAGPNAGYTFVNLGAGTYQLRLKDAGGCESAIVSREVKSVYGGPTFLNNNQIVLDASCGKNDGECTIIPTSGVSPFMYSKDGGTTYVAGPNAGYTFENLAAGTYDLRLKGSNGCESPVVSRIVKTVYNCPPSIAGQPNGSMTMVSGRQTVLTYPNPTKGQFRLQMLNFTDPKAEVSIFDAKGTLVQRSQINLSENTTANFNLSRRAPGLYYVKVITNSGIKVSKILLQ